MFDGVKQLSEVKLPSVVYLDSSQAVNAINQIYQYYKQKTPQDPGSMAYYFQFDGGYRLTKRQCLRKL